MNLAYWAVNNIFSIQNKEIDLGFTLWEENGKEIGKDDRSNNKEKSKLQWSNAAQSFCISARSLLLNLIPIQLRCSAKETSSKIPAFISTPMHQILARIAHFHYPVSLILSNHLKVVT